MTTFTSISNALVAVGAKPFATTVQALRDNPLAIAEADTSVAANLLPTVLLGTITTTSGSSQSLSSLVLTPYKSIKCFVNGVSSSSSTAQLRIAGIGCADALSPDAAKLWYGMLEIDLGVGIFGAMIGVATSPGPYSGSAYGGSTGYSTATTSITFSVSAGSFDAGSIRVYGCK